MTALEEQINEKKTANAETGMMGFYKNFLTKNQNLGGGVRNEPAAKVAAVAPLKNESTRDKIEGTLKALKEKQAEKNR